MTTGATTPDQLEERPRFLRNNWLLSPWADSTFLFGGAVVSLLFFFAWEQGLLAFDSLMLIWIFGFQGSHFWGQLGRTYADSSMWREKAGMLVGLLGWLVIGPVLIGIAIVSGQDWISFAFFALAPVWAYHHVVKQHFGFLALYRAKAKQYHPTWFPLEKWYLMLSLWLPLGALFVAHPELWVNLTSVESAAFYLENRTQVDSILSRVVQGIWVAFWTLQAAYLGVHLWQLVNGRRLNLQAFVVVACPIALHYVVFTQLTALAPTELPLVVLVFVPAVTIFHNIQYHALVWFYCRQKYVKSAAAGEKRYGLAHLVNRNLLVYFAIGTIYTVTTVGTERYPAVLQYQGEEWYPLFRAFIWGFAFLHYDLDARIWKVSKDEDLRETLGFNRG
ncbi:MAG: hypothetical protein AAF196_16320 [Planctomycetota bacterium]